jgi:RNA polymerase sigma-70 factor (ECF subfamily)
MSIGEGHVTFDAGAAPDFVARIANGDRGAEAEFVRAYSRGVRALVRRHCRPGDPIVDDLAQEVLARVLERLRIGAVRDAAALPAYVQATIVYTTSAEYRGRHSAESSSAIDELAGSDNPLNDLASGQLAALLRQLLAQLPVARDREILSRFYLDEQDKAEVCRQLGIEASHFHRVVFRARERFRQLLDQAGIEEA